MTDNPACTNDAGGLPESGVSDSSVSPPGSDAAFSPSDSDAFVAPFEADRSIRPYDSDASGSDASSSDGGCRCRIVPLSSSARARPYHWLAGQLLLALVIRRKRMTGAG